MMKSFFLLASLLVGSSSAQAVGNPVEADVTPIEYMDGDHALMGHLAVPDGDGMMLPAVIVIPDWDGVNEYEHVRATLIAQEWGYVGFAADIYGADLQFVENRTLRGELATFYRSNPEVFGSRIRTAVEYVKAHPKVDPEKVAVFGYCFGGTGVLQYGLYGNDDVNALVSFHGGLSFLPEEPLPFGTKLLVLSGGEDDAVTDIMDLEITLDSVEAPWEITRYSKIEHAFTVFEDDRYSPWVDMRSWESAYEFITESFGMMEFTSARPDSINTREVDYVDETDGKELRGHLSLPSDKWARPLPAIVIMPDWDGANEYERERATALAELGYVAMVADIYGADKQFVESFEERGALVAEYAGNPELYMSRMQAAIDQVKGLTGDVDANQVGIIGYCFGGSGVILYSFFSGTDAKVAVAFHGSFSALPPVIVDEISPYLLVLSGGDDGLHGNQTIMEDAFNSGNADWEITRYAGVGHGFTAFESDAYNLVADARSWESMLTSFRELLPIPQMVDGETTAPVPELFDIPTTALNAGSFGTLVAALDAADLTSAVASPNGPFTVFAPPDSAFAALPAGLVDCLLLPQNVGALSSILTYHVLSGQVLSSDLVDGAVVPTLSNEETVTVSLTGGVFINSASVTQADILASNGVIHVIDSVLVPPSIDVAAFLATCPTPATTAPVPSPPATAAPVGTATGTITDLAMADPDLSSLVDLVATLGLADDLAGTGPFTVFAPTNAAFAAIAGTTATLDTAALTRVVTYHVIVGEAIPRNGFVTGVEYPLNRVPLGVAVIPDSTLVFVGFVGARLIGSPIVASNGIIHKVDKVMLPPP